MRRLLSQRPLTSSLPAVLAISLVVLSVALCSACADSSESDGTGTDNSPLSTQDSPGAPKLTVSGVWKAKEGAISAIADGDILGSEHLAVGLGLSTGPRLVILDLSNPVQPVEKGGIAPPFSSRGLLIIEDLAFSGTNVLATLVGPGGGLWIVDVSSPASPQHVAFLEVPGSLLRGLAVVDGLAFMVGYPGEAYWTDRTPPGKPGILLADVSDPRNPRVTGSLEGSMWGSHADVVVQPPMAYLVGPSGLYLIDVSDPTRPQEMGSFVDPQSAPIEFTDVNIGVAGYRPSDSFPRSLVVQGRHAYVASGSKGLRIIDVGTSAHLNEVGSISTGFTQDVAVSGQLAFTYDHSIPPQAAAGSAIRMLDVSQVGSPRLMASLDTQDTQFAGLIVALKGHVYATDGIRDLIIVSYSLE